jgi:cytochrome c oxidase cbb3-type subunit 2
MTESNPEASPRPLAIVCAVGAIAATYVYFLLFAEFALVELALPLAEGRLRWLLGALGVGGVAGSLLAARNFRFDRFPRSVANGFRACGLAAVLALMAKSWVVMMVAGLSVGLSLGWLTVTLVSGLRGVLGGTRLGLWSGIGTGVAYAFCNLPVVFNASPSDQTVVAALIAVIGALATNGLVLVATPRAETADFRPPVPVTWLVAFLGLVWLDSAAFYIIQHTEPLRQATWQGAWVLGGNALSHLLAAVLAGIAFDRGHGVRVVALALGCLVGAALWLGDGSTRTTGVEVLYTAGVSLYSTVLVAYPAQGGRPRLSAALFALAGWGGSALGIGLAQDLHHVPAWFCAAAAAMVGGALLWRHRHLRRAGAAALVVLTGSQLTENAARADEESVLALGRRTYVAEGCVHCHSQYVRPQVAADVERWGPAPAFAEQVQGRPPLLGNRRLGPDLSQVGNRRTSEWNRLHLIEPRRVSPGSRMPSYAHLFAAGDPRGDALVAYLASLGRDSLAARVAQAARWVPARPASLGVAEGDGGARARRRFAQLCAPCHGPVGRGDGPLAAELAQRPADLAKDAWRHVPAGLSATEQELGLARLIKFGVPGTAMAGREYLSDDDVVSLARFVAGLQASRVPRS